MQPTPEVSPQKLGLQLEQLGPATLGRQSHVPASGWQRSLVEPTGLQAQPDFERERERQRRMERGMVRGRGRENRGEGGGERVGGR